jgi:hypothetical protein
MAQVSFAKKRANPRFAFFAKAEVILGDGTSVFGQTSQLSSRGCYIESLQPIPVAIEFRLRITDGTSNCKLPGKVIYMHSDGASAIFGSGVTFGEMTVDQYAAIDRWLRERWEALSASVIRPEHWANPARVTTVVRQS